MRIRRTRARRRLPLPSPALIVGVIAVVLAIGGTASALSVKDKKKAGAIADQEIVKLAPILDVGNAEKLGLLPPSGYQRFCTGGAIKATAVLNTAGFTSPTFQDVPGFNCFEPGNLTSSVQVKKPTGTTGLYVVRIVGNSGPNRSGSAVVSTAGGGGFASYSVVTDPDAAGENVFAVRVRGNNGDPMDGLAFSLLAF
jgi:hypothetical protein